ncbi:hypothetical protein [Blattabacterium cuenoti]|uniref:hypothetical protein n=1 Tax=Blattabacterium cuenoti TaxID=1653831 RepID=UPI00374CD072
MLKASFFLNRSILIKNMRNKNFNIVLIYKSFYLPEFKNINESIINIFNKIIRNHC